MGEELPPVPGRLVDRIWRWEYIEMCELLPELLADQKGGVGAGKQMSWEKDGKECRKLLSGCSDSLYLWGWWQSLNRMSCQG